MSYILEALKKAQAERQLGSAPTIHAPVPSYAPPSPAPLAGSRYLLAGLGVGAAVAAAAFLWPRATPATQAQLAAAPAAKAPHPAPAAVPLAPRPAPPPMPAPEPAPAKPASARSAVPMPDQPALRAEAAPAAPPKTGRVASGPEPVAALPEAAAAVPEPERPVAAPSPQPAGEALPGDLHALPEALQREIPKLAFGGYIYSPNPAERLLLVDKTLRREGEEVAPGLVLERILPKAAVMNYRGNRYRVAY